MSNRIGLCLALALSLPSAPVLAWTEEDLRAAERILDRKLEKRRAAEAKAKAEAEAKAKAEAEAKAKAEAEAKAKAEAEAKAKAEAEAKAKTTLETIAAGMVTIPAGQFQMGCSPGDNECYGDEKPPHRVKVKSFRIGKYEVTQAQWQAVIGENPARFKGDDRPVETVSWGDIQDFLKRLNAGNTGKPYRLPTEAEWEYAARAGTETRYWWGRDIGTGNANCASCGSRWDNKETAPVGSFPANPFGLYDTAGNVWEWVADCWHGGYQGAPADGSEWRDNCQEARRVLRGGSWYNVPRYLRVSGRNWYVPADRIVGYGLRLAQDL